MARYSTVSTANHSSIKGLEQSEALDKIYVSLQRGFANERFAVFKQKCKDAVLQLEKYPKPLYFPTKFNSSKHKRSSTTAEAYLNLLTDGDVNDDLKSKSLVPVEIFYNGSALFRAVASLVGFSEEKDVLELRLRCLVDAFSNMNTYVHEHEEILETLLDPEEASITNWSNLVHEKDQSSLILSTQRAIIPQSNIISNPVIDQRRGTFILIDATAVNIKTCQTLKRIERMKAFIIEFIKSITKGAHRNDIIEINTCVEELKQPPLISFCEAVNVATKDNLDLISNIDFCEAVQSNSLICIRTAKDRLARQSVYYHDFCYFVDSLFGSKTETFVGNTTVRLLRESRSINSQIFISSEQLAFQKGCSEPLGIVRVNYRLGDSSRYTKVTYSLCEENDPPKKTKESGQPGMPTSSIVSRYEADNLSKTTKESKTSDRPPSEITILYGDHNSSKTILQSVTPIQPISNTPADCVTVNTTVRYKNVTNSTPIARNRDQQNSDRPITSHSLPSNASSQYNKNLSSFENFGFSRSSVRRRTEFRFGFS